ncbi:PH and SEC7 domain-containing protein 4 [Tamandua tetradactyla]|uniref:PH and SEC7 domain-containing protein 4 n=1 Tax=Tamandua tetradactyla TaxID=48850 RepID=UPI00405381A5
MDDHSPSEDPWPLEGLNTHPGAHLQPSAGPRLGGASDPPEPPGGTPGQGPSLSTQAMFWAGILQAQMCVLDLEEELERTAGLGAELRGRLLAVPAALRTFSSSLQGSPLVEQDSEGSSDRPSGESPVWQGECLAPSPRWSAADDGLLWGDPLLPGSACSEPCPALRPLSRGVPDSWVGAGPEGTQPRGQENEAALGSSTSPCPVPAYSLQPLPGDGAPAAPAHVQSEPSQQALPSPGGDPTEGGPLCSQGRGESDAGCAQELAISTLDPGPGGSPASSAAPNSPEPESRGPSPGPRPPLEGNPQLQPPVPGHLGLRGTLDLPPPLLLDTEEAVAAQPAMTPEEGLPEDPMPQTQCPEEGQRPQAGEKLANGVRPDKMAWDLASRLYHLEGFRKSEVAAYLQKNNDLSRTVAQEYLSFFQFGGQSLDRALRSFLQALELSGESQERERVLYQFSRRFHHCNPGGFSVDSVHSLTCALMLLNTDLHGQNMGKSMSCQEFITNLNGLQDGGNFPKELLKALYWSIRNEKLEWAVDEGDAARLEKAGPPPPAGKMGNPLLQLTQDASVPTYKQGPLARKMHQDADGKKTPWGKRGWKMFHTLLRGTALYFLKGEDPCADGESLAGQMVDEPVGVHHSLASAAAHYTKRPHVFQLRTADWRLYLFQAPTAVEMRSWIARINLAAATHSAPPFPAAVGSQRRFVRPILPVGPARGSLEEQQRSHESCLDAAAADLLELQRNLPERRGRGRELEEHRVRKEYLEHEKTRYETYTQLLVTRLLCPSGSLDLWEEQLGQDMGDVREPRPSLKKSHSSPSLHQNEAPGTAKVKRNISERRAYGKVIPKRSRNQL